MSAQPNVLAPIVISDADSLMIFESVAEAESYLEVPDISGDETAFDSAGLPLLVRVETDLAGRSRVTVRAASLSRNPGALYTLLVNELVTHYGLDRAAIDGLDLPDIITRAAAEIRVASRPGGFVGHLLDGMEWLRRRIGR
jgi:hypothetical protein